MAEFIVTVPGGTGGGYYIDGVQKPIIPVVINGTFRFNQNDATNNSHPLIFSTTTSTAGIISTGVSYYLDGPSNSTNYRNTTLFNAATVRYIEITVAQTVDFYYICQVHGAGMGNVVDITVNTWGALSWNAGLWGQQQDSIFSVTGSQLDISEGQANYTPVEGWGRYQWGSRSWGVTYENQTIIPESFSLALTLSDETVIGEINSGWGRLTWGENAWGIDGSLSLVGQQLNLSLDPVSITAEVNNGWGAYAWGYTSWNTNTLDANIVPTGQQLNISLDNVDIQSQINSGWGRITWGNDSWGGDGIWEYVSITGQQLNISQGEEIAKADVTVEVFSTIDAGWGQVAWGTQDWGQGELNINLAISEGEVDPSPDATVVGIGMTIGLAVGTTVIGTGNVELTGQQLNISLGNASGEAVTLVSVTGIGLNTAVGTVFAGGNTNVDATGNGLTIALNSINNQIWTEINTGTDATWIEIDTAA